MWGSVLWGHGAWWVRQESQYTTDLGVLACIFAPASVESLLQAHAGRWAGVTQPRVVENITEHTCDDQQVDEYSGIYSLHQSCHSIYCSPSVAHLLWEQAEDG